MKFNRKCFTFLSFLIPFLFWEFAFANFQETSIDQDWIPPKIAPKEVKISTFYHHSTISVEFFSPVGCHIALKLEGKSDLIDLKKKGRVGLFWMNVGEIMLENAPQVYKVYTSENLTKLSSNEELIALDLGYESLNRKINIRGESEDKLNLLQEFYKFKEKSGLFRVANGVLQPTDILENKEHYLVEINIPSSIPAGDYDLTLYFFKNGKLVKQFNDLIQIKKVGLTKFVSDLAIEHGAIYGLGAIVLAILVGFAIGILFSYLKKK